MYEEAEILHTTSSVGERGKEREWDFSEKRKRWFSVVSLQYISGVTFSETMWTCTWETLGWGLFSVSLTCMCDACGMEPECWLTLHFGHFRLTSHSQQHHLRNGQNHPLHLFMHDGVDHSKEKADTVFAFHLWRYLFGLEQLEISEF